MWGLSQEVWRERDQGAAEVCDSSCGVDGAPLMVCYSSKVVHYGCSVR